MKLITRAMRPMSKATAQGWSKSQSSRGKTYSEWNSVGFYGQRSKAAVYGYRYSEWNQNDSHSS